MAIASKTASLVKRVAKQIDGMPVSMSGGVARNPGVVKAIEESLGIEKINIYTNPDIIGALGAALIGYDRSS